MIKIIKQFHNRVLNDKSDKIKVLKGRQVGATTLAVKIALNNKKTIYVAKNNHMLQLYHSMLVETLQNNKIKYQIKENLVEYESSYMTTNEVEFYTKRDLENEFFNRFDDVGVIIYDEIEELELKNKPKIKREIYLMTPSETDATWYVVPSFINEYYSNKQIEEYKRQMSKKAFHQNIMAGVIFPYCKSPDVLSKTLKENDGISMMATPSSINFKIPVQYLETLMSEMQ